MIPADNKIDKAPVGWLAGGGVMGGMIESFDWSTTSLGSHANWPSSLKTAISIMLTSRYPMLIWWGPELIHFYNDAYLPVLGKRHPVALGKPAADVWQEAWPTVGTMASKVMTEGVSTWSEELPMLMTRNGYPEEVYMTFSYSPLRDDTGAVAGLFCACTEETQRVLGRRRLKTLRLLAEHTSPAKSAAQACLLASLALKDNPHDLPFTLLYTIDEDAQIASLAGFTGIAKGTIANPERVSITHPDTIWPFAAAMHPGQAIHVNQLPMVFSPLADAVLPKSPEQALVLPIPLGGDGSLAGWLVAGISPLRPLDEEYMGFLSLLVGQVATAIANARAYEQERERAEALAEIDRTKTAFFSNVSHEFRTPLTLMLGPLADALAEELPPIIREYLTVAYRNSERMLKLVNTLLDFARIEAGRMEAVFQPVDLSAFTAELASNFRSAIERAGMSLIVDCPQISQTVYVDSEMWEKIVLNLLSNAFKFTFQGSVTVRLSEQNGQVKLSVIDTGTGIAVDQLPHLFERFHRVRGAQGRSYEGSGIGLALLNELVKLHHGQIHVKSELNHGSEFTITIPTGKAHLPADRVESPRQMASTALRSEVYVQEALRWFSADQDQSPEESEPFFEAAGLEHSGNAGLLPGRILLVDDNADMRQYLLHILKRYYQVVAVPDGVVALESLKEGSFDLVLADVMMPRLDGFGLLKAIREQESISTMPVILLSARAGEESRMEGLNAGADDYLTKPFMAKELLVRIETSLKLHALRARSEKAIALSERRFRHFVEASSDFVYQMSADWKQMEFLTGKGFLVDTNSPSGNWVETYIPTEDRPAVWKAINHAIANQNNFQLEHRIIRSDGSIGWVFSRALPVRNELGQATEWFGTAADITIRKTMENSLRDADQRKDEFLAMLAHELRNPVATIQNGLSILKIMQQTDSQAAEIIDMMTTQGTHLIRMIDDLLDVSRVTRGKIELRSEPVEIGALIDGTVESIRPQFEQRQKKLHFSKTSAGLFVQGDSTRLSQVVTNLLTNSLRYTGQDGQVWVSLAAEHEEVIISVKDNGIGLSPEQRTSVFGLFVQADNSLARSQGGLGIGLTLVNRLVEMHGGRVEAHSPGIGQGSEFRVYLPLFKLNENEQGADYPDNLGKRSPLRILVIDDMEDLAKLTAMLLQLRGYEVEICHSGLAGIEVVELKKPSVILCDIGMPLMDGYETAKLIRKGAWGRKATLIALSGYGQEEDKRMAKEAGFDAHLIKPINIDELEAQIAKHSIDHAK